jgi:hypothetical protein
MKKRIVWGYVKQKVEEYWDLGNTFYAFLLCPKCVGNTVFWTYNFECQNRKKLDDKPVIRQVGIIIYLCLR